MLILTEKPSVAKDFASALNCSYSGGTYTDGRTVIVNCIGHLFELEEPAHYGNELPIIPEKYDYRVNPTRQAQAALVVSMLKAHKTDQILIATDADREGEIIARECLVHAGITDLSRIRRFWVSEALTPEVIEEGMKKARPLVEYNRLAMQGFARQQADWLTGMNFCRYITQAAGRKLVVGRVQTAILSAIDQRCEAIRNFKSTKYFEHFGTFSSPGPEHPGCYGIYSEAGCTGFSENSREAVLNQYIGRHLELCDSRTEKKQQTPPQLYNLNSLQKDAFRVYGYSAEETLRIVQSLYEELKCVSYPRTPSRVMGTGNVELCQKIAEKLCAWKPQYTGIIENMDITLSNKRCFDDAKLEAHHALIPLSPLPPEADDSQTHIYALILTRFLISFLPSYEYEKQTYTLSAGKGFFKITGRKTLKDGWKSESIQQLLPQASSAEQQPATEQDDTEIDNQLLENIDWNRIVLTGIETKERWTKPPARYNEASILTFMEKPKENTDSPDRPQRKLAGLGTAATRHTFIPKLMKNGYIDIEKKSFFCTDMGRALLKAVRNSSISSLADVSATTDWEQRLEDDPAAFLNSIKRFVFDSVRQKVNIQLPGGTYTACPVCGKAVRRGKAGWYCTGYKDGCSFKIWETCAGARLTDKDVIALCAGRQTGIKHCMSRAGKKFDCRFMLDNNSQITFVFEDKPKRR